MGLAGISAVVFLRIRFGVGEAAGESAAEDDVALSAGEAVAAAFLDTRSFGGERDSVGSQSAAAIELAQRKWLGRLQKLMEAVWWP